MHDDILLYGSRGHASDLLSLLEAHAGTGPTVHLFDDDELGQVRFEGRDVRPCRSLAELPLGTRFVCAAGRPEAREAIAARATSAGLAPVDPLVHPRGEISFGVSFGPGSVVMGLSWCSPLVTVGRHCYVAYGSLLGHDVSVGDFTSVLPGATIGGDVAVGRSVLVGARSSILEGRAVGDGAVIGAGAVVTEDVPAGATVVGVPARSV